jgi:hypothetical protein
MNVASVLIVLTIIIAGCDARDSATTKPAETSNMSPKSHIPHAQLQQMFDGIRQKTKWNIDGNMLWGYFFTDTQTDRLKGAQRELEAKGYRFVDLYETERDGKPSGIFMLHVEKVETHTVDSLDTRNGELDALAAKHRLKSYDGMDVGPVTHPTTRPAE